MTLEELKAKHPQLYQQCVAEGRQEERARLHRTCPWFVDILKWHKATKRADGE